MRLPSRIISAWIYLRKRIADAIQIIETVGFKRHRRISESLIYVKKWWIKFPRAISILESLMLGIKEPILFAKKFFLKFWSEEIVNILDTLKADFQLAKSYILDDFPRFLLAVKDALSFAKVIKFQIKKEELPSISELVKANFELVKSYVLAEFLGIFLSIKEWLSYSKKIELQSLAEEVLSISDTLVSNFQLATSYILDEILGVLQYVKDSLSYLKKLLLKALGYVESINISDLIEKYKGLISKILSIIDSVICYLKQTLNESLVFARELLLSTALSESATTADEVDLTWLEDRSLIISDSYSGLIYTDHTDAPHSDWTDNVWDDYFDHNDLPGVIPMGI